MFVYYFRPLKVRLYWVLCITTGLGTRKKLFFVFSKIIEGGGGKGELFNFTTVLGVFWGLY